MPRLCIVALCGAALTFAAAAVAQTPSAAPMMRLGWVRASGAERCPDASTIARAIEARVGRPVFSADAAQSVEALIQRADERWSVAIFLRDVDGSLLGSRTLSSERPECDAAASSAIFAMALAIDPESALRPETHTQSTPPVQHSDSAIAASALARQITAAFVRAATTPTRAPTARAVIPTPPPRVVLATGSVAMGAWLSWGLLPQLAAGAQLDGYARLYHRLGLRGSIRWLPEQLKDSPQLGDVSFGLVAANLSADVELVASERAALSLYAGPLFSAIHAIVRERAPVDSGERLALGLALGAHGALQLFGPLELQGSIELVSPLLRYRYQVEGASSTSTVFEQPWLTAGASLALAARFR